MTAKQFKNIALEEAMIATALEAAGVEKLSQQVVQPGKLTQYGGYYQGKEFLIRIYSNGGGKCTIGHTAGRDPDVFNHLAQIIVNACAIGNASPVNLALPRFADAHGQLLIEFLLEHGAEIEEQKSDPTYRLIRMRGPRGDKLTIKFFNNDTLHLQGSHVQVAAWALDYIQTVLPLDEVLAHQKAVYRVPMTIDQIQQDLEARIPYVHDRLSEAVRIQLSSSLALTKAGVALEDYAAIAFPALRGLEGYCFQLLKDELGVNLPPKTKLGELFESEGLGLRLISVYTVSPDVHGALVKCYALWHSKRHRLFHMDTSPETSRVLDTHADAVALVDEVLTTIEESHRALLRPKEEA